MPARSITVASASKSHYVDKKRDNHSVVCMGIITLGIVLLGGSLLIVGVVLELKDLYIIGAIFLCAAIGFVVMLTYLCKRNCHCAQKEATSSVYPKRDNMWTKHSEEQRDVLTPISLFRDQTPTAVQLYGEDKIIHVPERVKQPPLPLPESPPVYFPGDPSDSDQNETVIKEKAIESYDREASSVIHRDFNVSQSDLSVPVYNLPPHSEEKTDTKRKVTFY